MSYKVKYRINIGKKKKQQISHLVWDASPESKGQREEHNSEYKVVMTCRLFNVWRRKDDRKVIFLSTKKLWAVERTKYKYWKDSSYN